MHDCEFTFHSLADDRIIRCDRPANLKFESMWFCAEHYDFHERATGIIRETRKDKS